MAKLPFLNKAEAMKNIAIGPDRFGDCPEFLKEMESWINEPGPDECVTESTFVATVVCIPAD